MKKHFLPILIGMLCTAALFASGCSEKTQEMAYLGVENYGAPETNKDNIENFRYRFSADGKEAVYKIKNDEAYSVQNVLKEGYPFRVTIQGDTVVRAEAADHQLPEVTPPVSGTPGEKTLTNLLKTAMMPAGTTLYIYGGGWDWQDEAMGAQTRSIGVSPYWVDFFRHQDENFTYKNEDDDDTKEDPANSYYPFGAYNEYYFAGLDCSAYLNWVFYNTFQTSDGQDFSQGGSTSIAKNLSENGWGSWTQDISASAAAEAGGTGEMKPGDIMSINGHVWMSLGTCSDGSIVIVHSTPSLSRTGQPGGGVQISALGSDEGCEAYILADQYMSEYFPEWYERYPAALKDPEVYFTFEGDKAGKFSWDVSGKNGGLTDPDGVQEMMPEQVLELLF